MNVLKYTTLFLLFLFLHFIEGLPSIEGISIGQLWKIPIIMLLVALLLLSHRKFQNFEKTCYFYSIEPLFCPAIFTNPFSIILFAFKQLPTMLFFNFWHRFNFEKLEKYLIWLAQFISLTSLVTLLNVVEPIRGYLDSENFVEGGEYYSSLFGAPHAASSYFVMSTVIMLYYLIKGRIKTKWAIFYNLILLMVSIYSLYICYVRTGWFMLLLCVILFFDYTKITLKKFSLFLLSCLILVVGILFLWQSSESFRARMSGTTRYNTESSGQVIDVNGSGRVDFWINGVTNWSQNDTYGLLFGKGYDAVCEDNYKAFGNAVFSHSLFVDALCQYGIISLVLLLFYNLFIFRFIRKYYKHSDFGHLCLSLFIGSLIFNMFQSEIYFNYAIALSLALALMYKTSSVKYIRKDYYKKQMESVLRDTI